jgi:UDP-GlcNAc:undecaprenyl-phosphate GlcNAc-1-phosphate transferase
MIKYYFLFFLLNLLLFLFDKKISKTYNLFDYPDNIRKLHSKPMPVLGGLYLLLNLFFFYLIYFFFLSKNINFYFFSDDDFFFLLLGSTFFFALGYIDDKYHLSANIKLIVTIVILLTIFYFDKNLLLTNLQFTFYNKQIILGHFSYVVTILCFLLFINAFNMLDGINGQAISYTIFIFCIFISSKILFIFFIFLIISLIFILILNFKKKTYLGDSGALFLGFLIAFIFIKSYNLGNKFYADEIFLIMLIPGFELLRLSIKRIANKRHPFMADSNHIHHIILRKFKFIWTYFIIQIILIIPYLIYLFNDSFFYSFIISVVIYFYTIHYFSKNNYNQ